MKRVLIVGCPGSGKSTFARKLSNIMGLPLYHLDMLYWNKDKTTVPNEVFDSRLDKVLAKDTWIIDGNYARTMERRLKLSDTVFFLDLPTRLCLQGVMDRRGCPRSDMPWIEKSGEVDEEFIEFIKTFNIHSRPQIISFLDTYKDKDVFVFTSRDMADDYLRGLTKKGI